VRRALPVVAALAASICALCSCGLEQWPFLERPGDPAEALPGTPLFQVINVVPRDPIVFRGFELYYKFYGSDQSALQTSESGLTTRAELVTADFWRMCSPGKLTGQTLPYTPLIDCAGDLNDPFTTVVDFDLATPVAHYGGGTPRDIPIRRYATDALGDTKKFDQSELEQTDVDLTSVTVPETGSGGYLNLVIYALSYGLQDFTDQLYSEARYLGYMDYQF
jgi:hypothetical protein